MSDIAIRVDHLSKLYHIGRAQQRHDTLRDVLSSVFSRQASGRSSQSSVFSRQSHPGTDNCELKTDNSQLKTDDSCLLAGGGGCGISEEVLMVVNYRCVHG
jgi:hypothetical protein